MPQEQSHIRERERTDLREPHRYQVIIHNDDFTTMDFVVMLLKEVFFFSEENALALMLQVHHSNKGYRHEFIMPEHLLAVLIEDDNFNAALNIFYSPQVLSERVEAFLNQVDSIPESIEYEPEISAQMGQVIEFAVQEVAMSSAESIDIPHLVGGILHLEESWAAYLLKDSLYHKEPNFMRQLIKTALAHCLYSFPITI